MPAAKPLSEAELGGASAAHLKRGAERARRREAANVPNGVPDVPDHLSQDERVVWDETVAVLGERQALSEGDGPIIELFARTKCRWQRESVALENEGAVIDITRIVSNQPVQCTVVNPRSKIVAQLERQLLSMLTALGLTPRARRAVKPAEKRKSDAPKFGTGGWVLARQKEKSDHGE
jgi:P27 family predicted phage terminase small subunit